MIIWKKIKRASQKHKEYAMPFKAFTKDKVKFRMTYYKNVIKDLDGEIKPKVEKMNSLELMDYGWEAYFEK